MSAFRLAETNDVLKASRQVFGIQLRETLRATHRQIPLLTGESFATVFSAFDRGEPIDTPRLRHWVTVSGGLHYSAKKGTDPDPSCVSHLFVDALERSRLFELHGFRLVEAWIEIELLNKRAFELVFAARAPRQLVLGSLGRLELHDDATGPLSIAFDGRRVTVYAGGVRASVEVESRQAIIDGHAVFHAGHWISTAAGGLEAPVHDSGLAEPYHANAAVVRSHRAAGAWADVFRQAIILLSSIDAEAATDCVSLSPAVLPLHNGGISFGSASPESILGLTYLPGIEAIDDVAECFLHEAMHQKLYRIEECARLFKPESPTGDVYYSPWRADPRPLRMALHGAYVFTGVAEMWHSSCAKTAAARIGDAPRRAYLRASQSLLALETIEKHSRLTSLGERFVAGLRQQASLVASEGLLSGDERDCVDQQLRAHVDQHLDYAR